MEETEEKREKTMAELKPCPFCGGQSEYLHGTGLDLMTQDNGPWIGCALCKIALHPSRWDLRTIEDRLRRERDEARAEVERLNGARKSYSCPECRERRDRAEKEIECNYCGGTGGYTDKDPCSGPNWYDCTRCKGKGFINKSIELRKPVGSLDDAYRYLRTIDWPEDGYMLILKPSKSSK